jgi:hypothetical protein
MRGLLPGAAHARRDGLARKDCTGHLAPTVEERVTSGPGCGDRCGPGEPAGAFRGRERVTKWQTVSYTAEG